MEQVNSCNELRQAEIKKRETVSVANMLVRLIGILLARAMPIEGVAPFGLAFVAMERSFTKEALISGIFAALGYATFLDETSIRYIGYVAAYLLFLFIGSGEDEEISPYVAGGAAVIISLIGGTVNAIWKGFSLGCVMSVFADAIFTVGGIFVFERNRSLLQGRRSAIFNMNKEEKVSMAAAFAIALAGIKNVAFSGMISAVNIISIWLTVQFALCGGSGAAAVVGCFAGIICDTWESSMFLTAAFALGGILSGVVSDRGRIATAFFMSLSIAVSAVVCGEFGRALGYFDLPVSVILIMLTPESLARTIGRISGVKRNCDDNCGCREYIKLKLDGAADSFRVLAGTFFELSETDENEREDMSLMFDGVAERVCRECSKISDCWVIGFKNTCSALCKISDIMESRGGVTEAEADKCFNGRCLRCRKVVNEMNRLFEIHKINCVWKSKLNENRELAGQQLASVAQILDGISDELFEERIDKGAEQEIVMRLASKKVEVTELEVTLGRDRRYFAYVGAYIEDNADEVRRTAEITLHSVLGAKMVMVGASKRNKNEVLMRFAQPEGYMIEAGVSGGSIGISGDNCTVRYLSDGKFAAALSDGMGTGSRAARDSGATVKLLGDFLEAGFDRRVAVRLVNSIMVMKSADEAFATVDMCVIDLYSGEAEFIKNGAEPSYIKRGFETEIVRAASLPVGVVRDMEIETFAHKLWGGDIIVMQSDGLRMKNERKDWIKKIVDEADPKMPAQELADRLLEISRALHKGSDGDDMTVIVLKLLERQ